MSNPISWTFGAIGSVVSFAVSTAFTGVCLAGIAGAALYKTKPDEKSLDDFIKKQIKKNIPGPGIIGNTLSDIANCVSNQTIDDMVVCRIATVRVGTNKRKYIGIFGSWFDITAKKYKFCVDPNGVTTVTEEYED